MLRANPICIFIAHQEVQSYLLASQSQNEIVFSLKEEINSNFVGTKATQYHIDIVAIWI